MSQMVLIYHPDLPDTQLPLGRPREVALQSVNEHYARGWLLVDPGVTPPLPSTPWYPRAEADSKFLTEPAARAAFAHLDDDGVTLVIDGQPVGGGGGGGGSSSASDLTSGTLAPARIADGSLPFTKMNGTLSDAQIPAGIARDSEVSAAVAALVASAPGTLDTLDELAAALGDDANFAASTATAIANAKGGAEGIKVHDGTTGGGTRPTGYARVRWVGGTTRPTNMITGDVWEYDA